MQELEESIQSPEECLEKVKGKNPSLQELQDLSMRLVSLMLQAAEKEISSEEQKQQKQMSAMMQEPHGKTFTFYMADQCFRSKNSRRVADQLVHLLRKFGVPSYLPFLRRLQLYLFKWVGKPLSSIVVPMMMWAMRKQTRSVIVPGEPKRLASHIRSRNEVGIRMNYNHLGEAILGEKEAATRLQIYLDALANPDIEYVSIKISTIYSQIHLLAWEETLEILAERLKTLYRAAMKHRFVRQDGVQVAKFVNLDMEEYRDLHLTVALFKKVLEEEEFKDFSAGIVLQAYLPDSHRIQQELSSWAVQRKAQGGSPIKIRIVKGANLAMESLEAALRGWPQAPFLEKVDVDANYKRMLLFGMQKEYAEAVHLGVGSHNLFDIAFALLLRASRRVEDFVCFEMLEGMAVHLSRVVQKLSGGMLLYCPAAKRQEFQNAVAYLIRRLDENTAEDHFLRDAFHLREGSSAWKRQVALFSLAFKRISTAPSSPNRTQNRLEPSAAPPIDAPFCNEADTDFSLSQNRIWAEGVLQKWFFREHSTIPIVIDGKEILSQEGLGIDPSHPDKKLYNYTLATQEHVELALQTAYLAAKEEGLTVSELSQAMARLSQEMRNQRGDLIGAMIADGGKTFMEADVEVSEAIDMAEYYRRSREELESCTDLHFVGKSVIVVIPPWNFPCAIPAGGIISALMAGNSVIFKPSRETVLVAWILVNLFWKAGIPRQILQFVTGASSVIGNQLISDPRVKTVILTGSTATAEKMLKIR
ncbi:MAG: bifunctional proline dehydrogenase/L-glutamate gamma-semialdehyde dehydrogenase, partial [Chlamydiales bacterium]|nr:bifunctional proline dehydrogenase/L-glutamate gamma-semialdehyde dehydrogenase [Chlamydiales bacterium]